MKKIVFLTILLPSILFSQVQFKSPEFEEGIRIHLKLTETDVLTLNSLDTIKKIDLSGLSITDVNDVFYLNKVKELDLSNNQIIDISPLLSLPRLQILNLSSNGLKSISTFTFSDKRHFKLFVYDNEITDFQFLQTATFANVEVIGMNSQRAKASTYLLNNLYTQTDQSGQAIIKYTIWDSENNCTPFTLHYGDGTNANTLKCDSYTNTQNYTYSSSGFKNIEIKRENNSLTTHFIAPYLFNYNIGQSYPLSLDLPQEVNLVSIENTIATGTTSLTNNQISYNPITVGVDTLKVKYKYGTSNRIEQFYIVITNSNTLSVLEHSDLSTITVYPNPTKGIVNISSQNETINQINVYNLLGALLKSKKGNSDKEEINIQDCPNATYLVEIKTDKETQTVKIIKE